MNILVSLKKFITNKNTITVLGVIAILGLLFYGYNATIRENTQLVRVCYAAETIQPRTKITDDMLRCTTGTDEGIPKWYYRQIRDNIEINKANIIGKYTAINSVIPEGSFFYKDVIINEEDIPSNAFYLVPEGQRPYLLSVNMNTTYGNSIMPETVVDIYMKALNENGQVMVGKLLEKVKVLAVKDSLGNNVFENTTANRTPATLLFGVQENVYVLMKKAEYLKSYGVEFFPVPYGGSNPIVGETEVGREELVNFINSHTVTFSESE